jgi:transcriptional regulator with XRE-family HTH domain
MDPIDIQYELRKKKILQQEIAKEAGVSAMSVSKVINGKLISTRLMELISEKLGKEPRDVFAAYPAEPDTGRRVSRQGNQ